MRMKKTKFTEAQIVFAFRQAKNGTKVEEVCRKLGISSQQCLPKGRCVTAINFLFLQTPHHPFPKNL